MRIYALRYVHRVQQRQINGFHANKCRRSHVTSITMATSTAHFVVVSDAVLNGFCANSDDSDSDKYFVVIDPFELTLSSFILGELQINISKWTYHWILLRFICYRHWFRVTFRWMWINPNSETSGMHDKKKLVFEKGTYFTSDDDRSGDFNGVISF